MAVRPRLERQLFRRLVACVLAAVERLDESARTRNYLSTLWQFLRVQAQEGSDGTGGHLSQRRLGGLVCKDVKKTIESRLKTSGRARPLVNAHFVYLAPRGERDAPPVNLLPPDDSPLRLAGVKDGKAERVGEYEMRIQ